MGVRGMTSFLTKFCNNLPPNSITKINHQRSHLDRKELHITKNLNYMRDKKFLLGKYQQKLPLHHPD